MYVPFWQIPWPSAGIAVRTAEDPGTMIPSITAAVHRVDSQIALGKPLTMDQVRSEMLADNPFTVVLFATFAVIALLLAALGIYGVMAFSVAQRSHEIALRMALGCDRRRVVGPVVQEGLVLAGIGLAIGLVGAFFVGRAMRSMLFGGGFIDFTAFGTVGVILLLAALTACFLPARRAASINPMQALREE